MPAVSVIIPTYGHRDYVLATLDSVFAQTFTDYEVIVINDGSPDDTAAVLKPLVDAGRIRYVAQANAGQSIARNNGLALANGQFIAFLDDDDLWPADKLYWQVERLRSTTAVAVGGAFTLLRETGPEPKIVDGGERRLTPVQFFSHNAFFSPGQVLIRRDALAAIGGFDAALWGTDDLDLWMRLSAYGELTYVDRIALLYRIHAANASRHWERMLANGRRTLAKNIGLVPPEERAAAAAAGERFMYACNGSHQVQNVWSLNPARWRNAAKAVRHFAGPAVRHPKLAVALLRDCVPIPIRRALKRR